MLSATMRKKKRHPVSPFCFSLFLSVTPSFFFVRFELFYFLCARVIIVGIEIPSGVDRLRPPPSLCSLCLSVALFAQFVAQHASARFYIGTHIRVRARIDNGAV